MQTLRHVRLTTVFALLSMVAFPLFTLAISESAARVKAAVADERGDPYGECRIELLDIGDNRVLVGQTADPNPQALGTFITTSVLPPEPEL
jgi:hypothetical protein